MVLDIIHRYFKVQLPGYLKSLPLPKTFGGFAELTRDQWLELIPFLLFLFIVVYLILSPCIGALTKSKQRRPRVNRKQKLEEPKVAHTFDMEDLAKAGKERGGTVAYCRCWKSNKFPFCDGSHNAHNKETGDNVGPLVIKTNKTSKKE